MSSHNSAFNLNPGLVFVCLSLLLRRYNTVLENTLLKLQDEKEVQAAEVLRAAMDAADKAGVVTDYWTGGDHALATSSGCVC